MMFVSPELYLNFKCSSFFQPESLYSQPDEGTVGRPFFSLLIQPAPVISDPTNHLPLTANKNRY